jgi:predicted RNase H-like nuclease (RuvC/YqgF family)
MEEQLGLVTEQSRLRGIDFQQMGLDYVELKCAHEDLKRDFGQWREIVQQNLQFLRNQDELYSVSISALNAAVEVLQSRCTLSSSRLGTLEKEKGKGREDPLISRLDEMEQDFNRRMDEARTEIRDLREEVNSMKDKVRLEAWCSSY